MIKDIYPHIHVWQFTVSLENVIIGLLTYPEIVIGTIYILGYFVT